MFQKRETSVRVSISVFFTVVFLLYSNAFTDDYTQWKYWTYVTFNTTSSGANVSGNVQNFPVLIRLTGSNFTFGQAKTDGADLRFSKTDGTHLPYEIERWESTNSLAELWVLVDTVYGNNSTQSIKMYWGKPDAVDSSNSDEVFQITNNFAAVWHLGQDNFLDATYNQNHGLNGGSTNANGMIGIGKSFDGVNDSINCGSKPTLDDIPTMTIEAWINPAGWGGNSYGRIVDKGNDNLDGLSFFVQNNTTYGLATFAFMRDPVATSIDSAYARASQNSLTLGTWTYVVMEVGTNLSRLYKNGVETAYFMRQTCSGSFYSDAAYSVIIGSSYSGTNPRPFYGTIDEVRFSKTARTADWIKLNYETQKSGQTTVSNKQTNMPKFTANPVSDTVYQGDAVSFTVAVTGTPAPTLQWQLKQGSGGWNNIPGATGTTYSITSAAFSDSGTYRVVATNSSGYAVSSEAHLAVRSSAPSFTTHPQSQNISITSSVSFKAVATGNPQPTYKWQKRQGAGSWTVIPGAIDTVYSIASVAFTDSGSYRAVATNSWDSAFSNSAQLRVLSDAPAFISQPVHDTAHVGASASFSVTVSGNPTPSVKWEKRQTSGVWDSIAAGTTYTKAIVSFADSGFYRAVARNILGSATSASAHLLVWDSTISLIVQHPGNDTVLAGDTATFRVIAPQAFSFQWQERAGSGSPVDITGATSSIYKFKTEASDNNNWYRCKVSAGVDPDTSTYGILTIGTIPTITSNFPDYSVVATGSPLSLTGAANAIPAPTFKWCFIYKNSPPDTNIGTGLTFQRPSAAKADSGTYYFMARNRFGSKNSDSIKVHVLSPLLQDPPDLPSDFFVLNQGEMSLTFNVKGDGQISYQWYWKGSMMTGQTGKTLRINPVDSATHHNTTFYCTAISSYLGTSVDTLKSNTTTLRISKFTNPFKVSVVRVDTHNTTQVRVNLWSDVDISKFPSTQNPVLPWADSLWLIYRINTFPVSTAGAKVYRYSIDRIKNAAPNPVRDTLTVGDVPLPGDSCFWFSYSVNWHRPGGSDTLLTPLTNANKVFMLDTTAPPNHLVLRGEYKMKTDTVRIIIDSIDKIDSVNYDFLVVQCSKDSGYQSIVFIDTVSASVLVKAGKMDTIIWDKIGTLPLEKDTVYCRWFLKAKQTAAITQKRTTSFTIGWDRPVYQGTLKADSTFMGDRMHVEWSAVPPGTDSIRIWWNLSKIPLHYDPGLPLDHAHGVKSVAMNHDTIKGFTSNTVYYFGLQILNDDMWSFITLNSSDSEKTAMGDTFQIPNIIYIDSSRFDTVTNSMIIYWKIDKSAIPSGKTCESGYTYTLRSTLDTNPPNKWDSVAQSTNVTVIPLYSDIIMFDTSYTVGLWLRGVSPAPLGPGRPSRPKKDSSIISITIPSFTWQEVKFFPKDSLVYAANKKIILKRITNFSEIDTCRSYKNYTLPKGFFAVGGVGFEFKRKLVNIPSFRLGLKHRAIPAGVKPSDIGFYWVINGDFHVIHGFTVSTIAADSTVWYTVRPMPPYYDLRFPFVILADTLKPRIKVSLSGYSDTIPTGNNIPTYFTVTDNAANTNWAFKYGSGDQAYVYGKEGYTSKAFDSTTSILQLIDAGAISQSYGVRAIIVASDGIRRDTMNVSRQVQIGSGEVFSVPAKEWAPLRTTAHLNTPGLDSIFDASIAEPDPWKYDVYDCRLYRWHNPVSADSNYWLEYSEARNDQFDFIPGRVIWGMTFEDEKISYGAGVTTSLKAPYEIVLKAKNWTDISLPFQFSVRLKDVLLATAPYYDSLVVCQWKKDNSTYTGEYVYIYSKDSVDAITHVMESKQLYDGYTIYNHYSGNVTLKIPPTCLALSSAGSEKVSRSEKKESGAWEVDLRWRNTAGGEQYFKRVICGYRGGEGEDNYGPLPPSMSKVRVGVYDDSKNKMYGWALKKDLDNNGGITFEISLCNNSGNDAVIEYFLDEQGGLPAKTKARVYDIKGVRQADIQGNAVSTVAVDAGSSATRVVAVGPESYFERIFAGFLPMKLMKVYPNPFRGQLRIQYRIPFGIREVAFTVYNIQGKVLWHGLERNIRDAGEHIYAMGLGKDKVPAGVYILRLSARDARGKTIYGGEKRITCLK